MAPGARPRAGKGASQQPAEPFKNGKVNIDVNFLMQWLSVIPLKDRDLKIGMNAKILAAAAFVGFMGIANLSHAQTGTMRGNCVGCITEEALDQATNAAVRKDERLFNSFMGKQYVPIGGQQFSILDRGFIRSKIRVYVGRNFVDLYAPSEATR